MQVINSRQIFGYEYYMNSSNSFVMKEICSVHINKHKYNKLISIKIILSCKYKF